MKKGKIPTFRKQIERRISTQRIFTLYIRKIIHENKFKYTLRNYAPDRNKLINNYTGQPTYTTHTRSELD